MSRSLRAVGWAFALAVLAAGCQDYNFNPVGHCVIQPGTKRVTLSSVSSADVLFMVDDSGSMWDEQTRLAQNFSRFITNLNNSNLSRVSNGLEPFDFHLAVSTTDVYYNPPTPTASTCTSTCPGAAGQLVCCAGSTPARNPKRCTTGADCSAIAGTSCSTQCNGLKGESYCCAGNGTFPAAAYTELIPCSREGTACGSLFTHYDFGNCGNASQFGVAADQWPYPQGDFVSWTGASNAANPRVLHFDKELYTGTANKQGFTGAELVNFFKGIDASGTQGNIMVGTCGSPQEQVLNGARRAVEKALAGQQKDTYARTGNKVQTWDGTTRIASSPADWLQNPASKLVLVFVGDEDDCSSPQDPSGGVVMNSPNSPGNDACTRDSTATGALGPKEYTTQSFVDYFTGLGRPVGAAFILPAAQSSCDADTCTVGPGQAVCSGAMAAGYRYLSTAQQFRAKGADVVIGSICDPDFGALLDSIAEIVKPPSGLSLPTLPAAGDVTMLRIATSEGVTRKVCTGPLAPGSYANLGAAQATKVGWWFTPTADPAVPILGPSQFVYINPQGDCIANPGETYSADYIGQLPSGGCWDNPAYAPQGAETNGDAMCRNVLGGTAGSWTCFSEASNGTCAPSVPSTAPGTCICGARAANCAP